MVIKLPTKVKIEVKRDPTYLTTLNEVLVNGKSAYHFAHTRVKEVEHLRNIVKLLEISNEVEVIYDQS